VDSMKLQLLTKWASGKLNIVIILWCTISSDIGIALGTAAFVFAALKLVWNKDYLPFASNQLLVFPLPILSLKTTDTV
jgi:hypothetical protein